MKDKLYRKLNKNKPPRSVIAAAEDELKASRPKKRAYLRPVIAACCMIVLTSVVVFALANPYTGLGGCTSSPETDGNFESPNSSSDLSGTDTDEGNAANICFRAPFELVSENVYSDGISTIIVSDAPDLYEYSGELISESGIRVRYTCTEYGFDAFVSGYMLEINAPDPNTATLAEIINSIYFD